MKGMRKISRGSSFAGVVAYCLEGQQGGIGHGRLIAGTMAGNSKSKLSSEFSAVAALRPDILKPVWHSSLRMPKGEDVSNDRWQAIAVDYMRLMGWPPTAQFAVFKHEDEHVHIVANRVQVDATVYLGQNENLKSTRVIGELELRHGLTLTKGPKRDPAGKILLPDYAAPKKSEIERALRTAQMPAKLALQGLLTAAMESRPSTAVFLERLDAAGVVSSPSIARTGRMNGFAFSFDGVTFKGSQLGQAFAWANIMKEIDYEQARDSEELTKRRDASKGNQNHDNAAAADIGTSGRNSAACSSTDAVGAPGRDDKCARKADRRVDANKQGRRSHDPSRAAVVAVDTAGSSIAEANRTIASIAGPVVEKDLAFKVSAWHMQHAALGSPLYRLTIKDRRRSGKEDRSYPIGRTRNPNNPDTLYDAGIVEQLIPDLRRKSALGFDVFIEAVDPDYHYIVIDDVNPALVSAIRADGYQPCLIQESSADNVQVVIKTQRHERLDGQKATDSVVNYLNERYAYQKSPMVMSPLRMAGFDNRKQGRHRVPGRILETLSTFCEKTSLLLSALHDKVKNASAFAVDVCRPDRFANVVDQHQLTTRPPGPS